MKFGIVQKEKFKAIDGSYSLVTKREVYDSQITATDAETILLRNYFLRRNERIHVGNVSSNPLASAKEFCLYPSGKKIILNLVYPKPEKSELRLYISKRAGFFPSADDVWFLFLSRLTKELWIGSMSERQWRKENGYARYDDVDMANNLDIEDIDRQILEGQVSEEHDFSSSESKKGLYRSRELAIKRMQLSRFKCEFNSSHKLFIAKATGCPYLEVHHLIPMQFQRNLHSLVLDSLDNLCCLCPYCHSAIHHAEDEQVREMIRELFTIRDISKHFHLSIEDLERFYSVEKIIR